MAVRREEVSKSYREQVIELVRRKGVKPFDPERYRAENPEPAFESEEELEAFIEDIYDYRRKHTA